MIIIDTATHEDLHSIQGVDELVFFPDHYSFPALRQFLDLFPDYFLVARIDEETCGYCLGGHSHKDAWILTLAVSPDFRSRGIGKILFENCVERFIKAQFESIKLTVMPDNANAINIYRKAGFETLELLADHYDDGRERFLMEYKPKA